MLLSARFLHTNTSHLSEECAHWGTPLSCSQIELPRIHWKKSFSSIKHHSHWYTNQVHQWAHIEVKCLPNGYPITHPKPADASGEPPQTSKLTSPKFLASLQTLSGGMTQCPCSWNSGNPNSLRNLRLYPVVQHQQKICSRCHIFVLENEPVIICI